MKKMYRRLKKSDTWHWVTTCTNYPTDVEIVERSVKPTNGELCDQCKAKAKEMRIGSREAQHKGRDEKDKS